MKYLLVLVLGVIAFNVFQHLREWYGGQSFDATQLTGEECSEVSLSTTVESDRQGDGWDSNSPPDIAFQVGTKWTAVCQNALTCKLSLRLAEPAQRIEVRVWDRDEKDQITGDQAPAELIGSGWINIDGPEVPLGAALVKVECLD